jgi:pectate lyase
VGSFGRIDRWRHAIAAAVAGTVLTGAAAALAQTTAPAALPAFPGAEGAGATTPGGRGGEVYTVTNLNDDGPGSFRDAVSKGNRIVVFAVSGTIELKSRVSIREGNLTVAGQTAPGDGVCLRGYALDVRASDIVLRHLRFRLGDETKQETDSLTVWHGCRNVVVDHCSATWSVDEALSLAGDVQNVTVQWCLIAEALHNSAHRKGSHGYGSLSRATGPVTWHHNLWAHNDARNPRLGDNYGKDPRPTFDVRNNVVYDYGGTGVGLTQGIFGVNFVGNYLRPGPGTKAKRPIDVGDKSDLKFYMEGNLYEPDASLPPVGWFKQTEVDGKKILAVVDKPFDMPFVHTTTAKEAYDAVLANVGATLPARDPVDGRIIEQVKNRTGRHIDSQSQVGGWPELKSAPAPADTDGDGMPDAWETAHGLNPADPKDGNLDADNDGYTNVEEYLNGTDPKQFVDYRDPKNNIDPRQR